MPNYGEDRPQQQGGVDTLVDLRWTECICQGREANSAGSRPKYTQHHSQFCCHWYYVCCAMLCISMAYAIVQCMSVCLSVTFVDSAETNKHTFKFVLPPSSHTILVYPHQTSWRYSDGNPLMETLNAGGVGKNYDSRPISGFQIDDWQSIIDNFDGRQRSSLQHLAWTSIYRTDCHASVNLVYHNQHGRLH